MDFWIYIYTIIMVTAGAVPTYLYMRAKQADTNAISYSNGFEDGWVGGLSSPLEVKKAHKYYFETK